MNKISFIFFLFSVTIIFFVYYNIKSRQTNLIPLEVLFGNPNKTQVRISPDGKQLAYLAPYKNILNIHIKTIGKNDDHVITNETERGIFSFFWSFDSEQIFFLKDNKGDENYHLFKINLKNFEIKDLTPFNEVKFELISYLKQYPFKMIIGLNKDNKNFHDVYELDLKTDKLTLLEKNPGNFSGWIADRQLNVKGALESLPDGSTNLVIKDKKENKWKTIVTWNAEDSASAGNFSFTLDGKFIYFTDAKDSNTNRLLKFNLETKESAILFQDNQVDIESVFLDSDNYEVEAVSLDKEYKKWHVIDKKVETDFNNISKLDYGDFSIIDSDINNKFWLIAFNKDNGPIAYWLYDRNLKKGYFLFFNRDDLLKYNLAKMIPISYIARDGLKIHGYITFPISKKKNDLPLVLNVHGGPWSRDSWGYDAEAQWLANRGYVVLQVNFRGSTGYGKKFLSASFKEWGGTMQNDLTDAVNWAIDQKIANPKKVAIYGGSYGGYAALAGAAFTPDLYCCAVDIVGISNLITFLNSIPSYWSTFIPFMHKAVGSPDEKDFLISRSPLFKVDAIKIPIFIAQGANDPRVKQAESEQIVNALKSKGIPYEYLLFPDEGHGFCKAENRIKFYKEAEKFLQKYLK